MDQCPPNRRPRPRPARFVSSPIPSPMSPSHRLLLPSIKTNLRSSGTIAMMGLNIAKYYQTQHDVNGTQPLWAPTTFTWPNYLTLASASITFVAASVVLLAYCWGREAAERFDQRRALLAKFVIVVQVVSTGASAIAMYKTRANQNSLSGQTCFAPPAKEPLFPEINFETFCLRQVYAGSDSCTFCPPFSLLLPMSLHFPHHSPVPFQFPFIFQFLVICNCANDRISPMAY